MFEAVLNKKDVTVAKLVPFQAPAPRPTISTISCPTLYWTCSRAAEASSDRDPHPALGKR